MLVTDNVLWSGAVVPGMTPPQPRLSRGYRRALRPTTHRLPQDPRFYTIWLPIGDGASISTKVTPHMSERLKEFREFREKMNARIHESGNLEIKRFFALDTRAYE